MVLEVVLGPNGANLEPHSPVRPRLVEGVRLERLVGSGGEGEVWDARDAQGRRRALKLIRPEALATPGAVEERAAYLTRIDHPALVRVYRSGLLDGGPLDGWGFVEMDFVEGESLAAVPGDWRLLDLLLPLADALDLLHAGHWSDGLALVHRDVKPANIVATTRGRLVLVDPSTLRGVNATSLTRIGTPIFAAPEVLTGRMGPAADVYSFAVTVLALLSGARGAELAELVEHVADLDVPEGVRVGLAPRPEDRPVSCHDLLIDPAPVLVRDTTESGHWVEDWPAGADLPGMLRPARRRVWSWFAALAALLIAPLAVAGAGMSGEGRGLAVIAGAAVVHLGAHALDRRSVPLALFAPPMAWAFLLGDRLTVGRRRAWAHAVLCGPLTAAWGGVAAAVTGVGVGRASAPLVLTVVSLGLVIAAFVAVRAEGWAGVFLRLLLLPAWLVGALILIGAAVLALPPALLTGRGRAAVRLLGGTLAGAVETFRAPQR
ncbi:MAG TPA: hypothetical protein VM287_03590 [Egibacteraceae bacterium]|nr:hypothetical protein [Egibacteraceae bacterium]